MLEVKVSKVELGLLWVCQDIVQATLPQPDLTHIFSDESLLSRHEFVLVTVGVVVMFDWLPRHHQEKVFCEEALLELVDLDRVHQHLF